MKPYPLYELIVNHNGSAVLGGVGDDKCLEAGAVSQGDGGIGNLQGGLTEKAIYIYNICGKLPCFVLNVRENISAEAEAFERQCFKADINGLTFLGNDFTVADDQATGVGGVVAIGDHIAFKNGTAGAGVSDQSIATQLHNGVVIGHGCTVFGGGNAEHYGAIVFCNHFL